MALDAYKWKTKTKHNKLAAVIHYTCKFIDIIYDHEKSLIKRLWAQAEEKIENFNYMY